MNFFESQDRARKHTILLVALFALAVLSLIVMTNLLVMFVMGSQHGTQLQEGGAAFGHIDWKTFFAVGAGVTVVVLAGSLFKIFALSAGGKVVAESLGGQLIPRNTEDPNRRKVLDVVEEMAIASGTPAPPVYVLQQEPGINAFAAGLSPRDAVIGITRGAIEQLTREQLQGVIAHEFSHIFNGDMRLNIRLMGALNGILILGTLGYYLLYSNAYAGRRRGDDRSAAAMMVLAIGLMVIGFAGTFFGALIKAAVSRQREYLADASAVQYTRNPHGIAGALKRIAALEFGSRLAHPGAAELSHAYFAQGVTGLMQSLSATHPPLADRIRRIDPTWDGKYDLGDRAVAAHDAAPPVDSAARSRSTFATAGVAAAAAAIDATAAHGRIGSPQQEAIDQARVLLSELPPAIKEAAREAHGARALVYAFALDSGPEIRSKQLAHLSAHADPAVYELTQELAQQGSRLDIKYRLPLLNIAIPALKQLSHGQYESFKANLLALIEMDSRVDLLEWSLQKILFNHLEVQHYKVPTAQSGYARAANLKAEARLVLSLLAHAGAQEPGAAAEAFGAAARVLGLPEVGLLPKDKISIAELDLALRKLERLKPLAKSTFLKACIASVRSDQKVTAVELELLRAFAGALDCPIPQAIV